ncbi:MAG: IS21 family transposase [Tetrasphaera sp.]
MELFEQIRRDRRLDESISIRGLADRYGVHRRTVRAALADPVPPQRKLAERRAPVLDGARELIDAMLTADLTAPRKQRHTAVRVRDRLVTEHGLVISYSTVRDYVRVARPRIAAEAGRSLDEVFVPQWHEPGAEAEVDFADLWVDCQGQRVKWYLFTFRMSYSGKAVHRVYQSASQESFLAGHVAAFTELGGVPVGAIRYDNLSAAVKKICQGRSRVETDRWTIFRSYYGFDAFYCRPGRDGAHEKGGVEGEGGRFRRTHLVPVPAVTSVGELNALLAGYDTADDARRVGSRTSTVGFDFAHEKPLLRPLPAEPYEVATTLTPRVDRHARVSVRQVSYSVPARLVGRRVRVVLDDEHVSVYDGQALVAVHARSTNRGSQVLVLDHYLDVLARKPGALPGALALAQARTSGVFTSTHDAWWDAARRAHPDDDAAATRSMIEVLLLHRNLPAAAVLAGIQAALAIGATNPDVVAVQARHAATAPDSGIVIPLPARIETDPRPVPDLTAYDTLLNPATTTETH